MTEYSTALEDWEAFKVTGMFLNMSLGAISYLASLPPNPSDNPLANSVGIMLDIDGYGRWDRLTAGEYLGLTALCREGHFRNGRYYMDQKDETPFKYAIHTLSLTLENASSSSAVITLFCNVRYKQYYRFVTSDESSSDLVGFRPSPKLLEVIRGYSDFSRSGYYFWRDEGGYYRNMSANYIGNLYKFLAEPVLRSKKEQIETYINPVTAMDVVLSRAGKGD